MRLYAGTKFPECDTEEQLLRIYKINLETVLQLTYKNKPIAVSAICIT